MPEMRHRWLAGRFGRGIGVSIACCASAFLVGAALAAASPIPTPVATPEPAASAPVRTLQPPAGSPFDEVVGGARLAVSGEPILPDGVAPPNPVDAKAWLVADLTSGRVLGALNPHQRRPPASTIKLLTALALLPEVAADATYTVTDADITVEGSRVGLVPGQRYTREALAHGLLLASGNDAANALAQLSGGRPRALNLMAGEAKRLGAFDTTATTTHGLDDPRQRTSAYDLALIARAFLDNKELAAVARTRTYDFPGLDAKTFQIQNHNRLLGSYAGALGLKTGFTTLSGHTVVAAANRDGVELVAVVLGAKGRAEPVSSALLDWGYSLPRDATPIGRLETPAEVAAAMQVADSTPSPPAAIGREQDATTSPAQPAASVPVWAWSALVAAGVAVAAVTTRRRRKPAGRWADHR